MANPGRIRTRATALCAARHRDGAPSLHARALHDQWGRERLALSEHSISGECGSRHLNVRRRSVSEFLGFAFGPCAVDLRCFGCLRTSRVGSAAARRDPKAPLRGGAEILISSDPCDSDTHVILGAQESRSPLEHPQSHSRESGKAIVFITHKLDSFFRRCEAAAGTGPSASGGRSTPSSDRQRYHQQGDASPRMMGSGRDALLRSRAPARRSPGELAVARACRVAHASCLGRPDRLADATSRCANTSLSGRRVEGNGRSEAASRPSDRVLRVSGPSDGRPTERLRRPSESTAGVSVAQLRAGRYSRARTGMRDDGFARSDLSVPSRTKDEGLWGPSCAIKRGAGITRLPRGEGCILRGS